MTTDREQALRDARIWLGAHEARAGNSHETIEASRIIRDLAALAQPVAPDREKFELMIARLNPLPSDEQTIRNLYEHSAAQPVAPCDRTVSLELTEKEARIIAAMSAEREMSVA